MRVDRMISRHIRSNIVGYVAIFLFAIGGTAYATHPGGADTISTADIINGAVSSGDISNVDGVRSEDVRDDTLANGGLQAVDLGPGSVGTSEITDGGVTRNKIVDGAVSNAKIAPFSILNDRIGSAQVDNRTLATGAVNSRVVADGSLGTTEFASLIPAARVTRALGKAIPRNSVTTLDFNTERYDTANMHSNTTNPTRLTAPVSGIYAVTAQVRWDATGSGYRCLDLRRSGAEVVAAQCWDAPIIVDPDMNVSTMLRLAPGDFVEARATQSCCDTLPILKRNAFSPEFSMTWLAPGP